MASDSKTIVYQAQQPLINETSLNIVWDSLGKYLSRNLRNGRGIIIPKFGTFTFSAPVVTLDGVTNPNVRDLQSRVPVFIVSPEFLKGGGIRSGIFYKDTRNMRPYTSKGVNGKVHQIKCSFVEIGYGAGVNKDVATCIYLYFSDSILILSKIFNID